MSHKSKIIVRSYGTNINSPVFGVASLQLRRIVALDTSISAWFSRCVVAHKSSVFERLLLFVDALGVVLLTHEDVAGAVIVNPLLVRIAHFERVRLGNFESTIDGALALIAGCLQLQYQNNKDDEQSDTGSDGELSWCEQVSDTRYDDLPPQHWYWRCSLQQQW